MPILADRGCATIGAWERHVRALDQSAGVVVGDQRTLARGVIVDPTRDIELPLRELRLWAVEHGAQVVQLRSPARTGGWPNPATPINTT